MKKITLLAAVFPLLMSACATNMPMAANGSQGTFTYNTNGTPVIYNAAGVPVQYSYYPNGTVDISKLTPAELEQYRNGVAQAAINRQVPTSTAIDSQDAINRGLNTTNNILNTIQVIRVLGGL